MISFFAELLPGYYDGPYEVLVRDPSKAPYYDVVGGIISRRGEKIRLVTLPLVDALYGSPDLPIQFDTERPEDFEPMVERWREEARQEMAEAKERMLAIRSAKDLKKKEE